jgi:hypothetical protein
LGIKTKTKTETDYQAYLSSDPGVRAGVSPTLSAAVFLFFFSKYFLARADSLALYSFSMPARSR